jgi:uncharacterized protein (UPF0333 family)
MSRRGQSTVEYMLVIAVLVIAMVVAGALMGGPIARGLDALGRRAETTYTDGSITN